MTSITGEIRAAEVPPQRFSGSILFSGSPRASGAAEADAGLRATPPACFTDLHLDQVVAAVLKGRDEYRLEPYFYTPLSDTREIEYRQEVLRDLQDAGVRAQIRSFADRMRSMREQSGQREKIRDEYERRFWQLSACLCYIDAVRGLQSDMADDAFRSSGMARLRDWWDEYVESARFAELERAAKTTHERLIAIRYCVHILGNKVTVTRYDGEPDYSAEVEKTFDKFRQGDVESHLVRYNRYVELNHVEASILGLVAGLFPEEFGELAHFATAHSSFLDTTVERFDAEVQFLVAYLEHAERMTRAGLEFCFPRVDASKAVSAADVFDLALASVLVPESGEVVTNDFALGEGERVIVVTGANQGGKTTFSRTFGQLHYLATLGLLVPGSQAHLFLCDQVFTHYEREEDIHDLSGKLEDELHRIHDILQRATSDSIVIMNEIFTSTTLEDALQLGTAVLSTIIERDILCVCVTFVDELSRLSDATVSMVATVDETDPATRTFRLERKAADGLAYAVAVAEKYGLSYRRLTERIAA
ncbi:hypothetical protein OSC27_01135 [Microbacterium sp. STN6]|uniref:MutS-related protein n=1 Tax=Microbacterium sp. STN6 TaxID=2995588 RepID=UPI002260E0E7|nr:hypothetical protein [Microbacterium sp. STN6]MCX7520875.1 hypothetical protein [Microbacterium sp. STN6]